MKTRFDFVTNSSSSSFILGFRSRDAAIEEVSDSLSAMIRAYSKLLEDVVNAKPVDKEELIQDLEENMKWSCRREALYGDDADRWLAEHNWEMTRSDYEKTDEYKRAIKIIEGRERFVHEEIRETPFVIQLSYGSDVGDDVIASMALEGLLEGEAFTIKAISHH